MLTIAPCHFPIIRVQSQALTRSSLHRGNVNSAEDSHVRHMGDTLVSSVAQRSLRRLDQTRHHLTQAGDTDRPCQEQVRTGGRKCPPASATDHPASTGEATCLFQDGPLASGSFGQDSPELETSPHHCPAKDASTLASPGLQALLEIQVPSNFSHTQDLR